MSAGAWSSRASARGGRGAKSPSPRRSTTGRSSRSGMACSASASSARKDWECHCGKYKRIRLYLPQWHSQSFRAEDALAEQAIPLRLERPVVDRLGLGDFAPRPPRALALELQALALLGILGAADLLGRGDPDLDIIEGRALGLVAATKVDHLFLHVFSRAECHLQSQGLELLHQHVEGFRNPGLRQVLPLHDRLVHAAPAVHVVRL